METIEKMQATATGMPQEGGNGEEKNVGRLERNASMVGGASLAAYGVSQLLGKHYVRGTALALAGSYLVYRGKTGRCRLYDLLGVSTVPSGEPGVKIEEAIRVDRPREEVYRYWRNLENLPRFMKYLESVTSIGPKRYHWTVATPARAKIEWDADVTEERENEMLAWRSVPDSQVNSEGRVRFEDAPEGGTELKLEMTYYPPGGETGISVARLLNFITSRLVRRELERFKKMIEREEGRGGSFVPGLRP